MTQFAEDGEEIANSAEFVLWQTGMGIAVFAKTAFWHGGFAPCEARPETLSLDSATFLKKGRSKTLVRRTAPGREIR